MKALFIALCLLAGAPAGPALTAQESVTISDQKPKKADPVTVTFKTSMTCKNCVKKITENMSFERGVMDLKVTLENKEVTIKYDPSKTDEEKLEKAIKKLGYETEKVVEKK